MNTLSAKTEKVYSSRSKDDFDNLRNTLEEYGAYLGIL